MYSMHAHSSASTHPPVAALASSAAQGHLSSSIESQPIVGEKQESRTLAAVRCDYCNSEAKLIERRTGTWTWECRPCDAWVGVHRAGKRFVPLGRLANAELRKWRQRAHTAFDPVWQAQVREGSTSRNQARRAAYRLLAQELGIAEEDCHIAKFDVAQCQRTVKISEQWKKN